MKLNPISRIKVRLGIDANGNAQKFFTDTCDKHMDKYIPKDLGLLRTNKNKEAKSITYESPYAHAQYIGEVHGSPVQNYTTPRNRTILGQKNVECRRKKYSKRGANVC